jgi:hypothetical protein
VPISRTWPLCMTMILSAHCTVESRWAMISDVRPSTMRLSALRMRKFGFGIHAGRGFFENVGRIEALTCRALDIRVYGGRVSVARREGCVRRELQ